MTRLRSTAAGREVDSLCFAAQLHPVAIRQSHVKDRSVRFMGGGRRRRLSSDVMATRVCARPTRTAEDLGLYLMDGPKLMMVP